jgi:opacity protein-like surface antigen
MNRTTPKHETAPRCARGLKHAAVGWVASCAAASLGWWMPATASANGFYIGASAVRTLDTLDRAALDGAVSAAVAGAPGTTLAIESSSTHSDAATWLADVGYRSSYLGVEASYLDLGHLKYEVTGTETSPFGTSSLVGNVQIRSRGPALALLGFLPLLDALEASVRAGAYEGKTTTDYSNQIDATLHSGSTSKTSTSWLLGAGIAYAVTGHLAVRLDYIHINRLKEDFLGQSFNVDLLTAGVTFAF